MEIDASVYLDKPELWSGTRVQRDGSAEWLISGQATGPAGDASAIAEAPSGLAALLTGAVITDQFVVEQSHWLPLALLVVAAVIARARWSRTEAVVGTLLRR
jgi:hypothetical protein